MTRADTPISTAARKLRSAIRARRGLRLTPAEVKALASAGVVHMIMEKEAEELAQELERDTPCRQPIKTYSGSALIGSPSAPTAAAPHGISPGMTPELERLAVNRHVQATLKRLRAS